ncbi:MAG: hypothetical protein ACK5H4_15480 [Lacrimispora sphenoides]
MRSRRKDATSTVTPVTALGRKVKIPLPDDLRKVTLHRILTRNKLVRS